MAIGMAYLNLEFHPLAQVHMQTVPHGSCDMQSTFYNYSLLKYAAAAAA